MLDDKNLYTDSSENISADSQSDAWDISVDDVSQDNMQDSSQKNSIQQNVSQKNPDENDSVNTAEKITVDSNILNTNESKEYMVLARKYRPMNFDNLIGQEALVRTLSNALKVGRVASGFMLTGVRGVGKTTTARIIAKALNCDNADENGNPPIKPCGTCSNCTDIAGDRHIDVLEMDAASNTGIEDIREIIESAKYMPSVGRYKIFILDEVHMLSKSAFNGLLKTLEEPPAHVKFIFATTEIRRVPITILSRCQRFDLRRVSVEQLFDHYKKIAIAEGYEVADDALRMIARSADGSVRDGLSILDQAIALSGGESIETENVSEMLGLSDRQGIYDLYENICRGDTVKCIEKVNSLYETGVEPVIIIQDLLDVTWWLTRFKMTPALANDSSTPEIEKNAGVNMAEKLSLPALSRNWQILMKGLGEVQVSDRGIVALEMVLVRLMYASELPTPEAIIKKLLNAKTPAPDSGGDKTTIPVKLNSITQIEIADIQNVDEEITTVSVEPVAVSTTSTTQIQLDTIQVGTSSVGSNIEDLATSKKNDSVVVETTPQGSITPPKDFKSMVDIIFQKAPSMGVKLQNSAYLVSLEPPKLTLRLEQFSNENMRELNRIIRVIWGDDWIVDRVESRGDLSIAQSKQQAIDNRKQQANNLDLVKSVKQHFPSAVVYKVENSTAKK